MGFRAEVRRALAAPAGGPLGRRIVAGTVTAIVADARDGERDGVALAELLDALVRAGVPRGRQFVLLAGLEAPREAARAVANRWRDTLGVPVIPHDPHAPAAFVPGTFAAGDALELDDELREAELVVLAGQLAADAHLGLRGGPACLWPGLTHASARAAERARLAALPPAERAGAALARSLEALSLSPADFALAWSADDPPRVHAGDPQAVFAACVAEGWLAALRA